MIVSNGTFMQNEILIAPLYFYWLRHTKPQPEDVAIRICWPDIALRDTAKGEPSLAWQEGTAHQYYWTCNKTDSAESAGARCTATLLHEMKKRGKAARFGVVSMCIGSGMGAAAVFEQGGDNDDLQTVKLNQHQSGLSMDAVV